MSKKIIAVILFIIIVASVLRMWNLGNVPISPDWDEVALGYNAYSIMETGKDEYGKAFPVVLRSFDDYKPALYAYLVVPFIKAFGLSVFAVRLPAIIFGVLAVFAVYFLVRELFYKYKIKEHLGLTAAFLLAISPWHLQFSRVAFETGVAMSFNIFAVLFFLKGLRKPLFLPLSSIFMALNLYVYQGQKVFVPLLFLLLVVIYRKELLSLGKKYIYTSLLVGALIALPMTFFILTDKGALARAQGVNIISDRTILERTVDRLVRDREENDLLGQVFNNRRVVYAKHIVTGYLAHFDPSWLFLKGDFDNNRHHAPDMGLLYLWELPFLLIGIYALFFGTFDKKIKLLIFLWLLISPIPASITSGVPHAVRTLNFLPTFQIITALGLITAISHVSNIKFQVSNLPIKYPIFLLGFSFLIFNFSYFLNQYFVQQNYYHTSDWQYGYKEMVTYIGSVNHKYEKIIVSSEGEMSQSYMFFLFYTKHDPKTYLAQGGTQSGGFAKENGFLSYEFRRFDYYKEDEGVLLVGAPSDFPENVKVIKEVYYPNGKLAMKAVEK